MRPRFAYDPNLHKGTAHQRSPLSGDSQVSPTKRDFEQPLQPSTADWPFTLVGTTLPEYRAVAYAEHGRLAPLASVVAENPKGAWHKTHLGLIVAGFSKVLNVWREGGYLIEDADGAIHQPIKPRE